MTIDHIIYHQKIKDVLGFSSQKTIEDAVRDLKEAFDKKNSQEYSK